MTACSVPSSGALTPALKDDDCPSSEWGAAGKQGDGVDRGRIAMNPLRVYLAARYSRRTEMQTIGGNPHPPRSGRDQPVDHRRHEGLTRGPPAPRMTWPTSTGHKGILLHGDASGGLS